MIQKRHSIRWRVWHRWLSLIFGTQMVVWAMSGAYMVFFDIDYIHGDHLVSDTAIAVDQGAAVASVDEVLNRYPATRALSLERRWLNGQSVIVYVLQSPGGERLLDARSLDTISLDADAIAAMALHYYAPVDGNIASVVHLTDQAPSEISPRLLPVWQVSFDGGGNTRFYLSQSTGELLTKRHVFWRGFDFVWMLHIMDYDTRSDIQTWWLKGFIIGTLVLMITGCVLLVFTLRYNSAVSRSVS